MLTKAYHVAPKNFNRNPGVVLLRAGLVFLRYTTVLMLLVSLTIIMTAFSAQAGGRSVKRQYKSTDLRVGAVVLPYTSKRGYALPNPAPYISRVPGQRYY